MHVRRLCIPLLFAVIVAAFIGVMVAAPAASANCTGAPNCSSGWYGSSFYDASSNKNFNQNIAVSWFADGHRRVEPGQQTPCPWPTTPQSACGDATNESDGEAHHRRSRRNGVLYQQVPEQVNKRRHPSEHERQH